MIPTKRRVEKDQKSASLARAYLYIYNILGNGKRSAWRLKIIFYMTYSYNRPFPLAINTKIKTRHALEIF